MKPITLVPMIIKIPRSLLLFIKHWLNIEKAKPRCFSIYSSYYVMGSCMCKENITDENRTNNAIQLNTMAESGESSPKRQRTLDPDQQEDPEKFAKLITEMLEFISFQAGDDAVPPQLVHLNKLAETADGWIAVIKSLIRTIPIEHPLGVSTISIVFDDCPLPAKETVLEFTAQLNMSEGRAKDACENEDSIRQERNVLVVIGCIADKFGGPQCSEILSEQVLDYLVTFLIIQENPTLVLHALIVIEKFGRYNENKVIINAYFAQKMLHPLLSLELYYGSDDYIWRQVGFFARWALDNSFEFKGRRYSFEIQDMRNINAILNTNDSSENLKISSDGLEARCDMHSFESVRATFKIDSGCWYYEAELVTAGVMQIGWASNESSFQNHEGFGVGDDAFSLAYDGCRRLTWHRAIPNPERSIPKWQPGDILGCLINIERQEAVFSLNGYCLPVCTDIFNETSEGFSPAASFMAHQQCRFNFGSTPFKYAPIDIYFNIINEHGVLTDEEKKVVPRNKRMEQLTLEDRFDGPACSLCYDSSGDFGIQPCEHHGFCRTCALKLETCPLCRRPVEDIYITIL